MAILGGVQFIVSLIMFTFLHKLSRYYCFGRWLMVGRLVRYLHPTNDELKVQAGIPVTSGKARSRKDRRFVEAKAENFTVPRSIFVHLETAKVEALDLLPLHFFDDYKWLMDFSLCAGMVYGITEIYYGLGDRSESNLSLLWCLLVVMFCLKILLSQTSIYFQTEEGGEKILCITFGFFFLVAAMGVLVMRSDTLEFGLEEGYDNFSKNAIQFLKYQGLESHKPISLLTLKICLALISSMLGALVTFPGLRLGKMHLDSLKYSKGNYFIQFILHVSFIFPAVILLLWVKPMARDLICGIHWRAPKIISESAFEMTRFICIGVFFFLRLFLTTTYLQSHLNMAHEKIEKMRKESGRISNIDLQKMVARVFYYLCFVALQYLTPLLLLLFLAFLLKSLGGYAWDSLLGVDHDLPGSVSPLSFSQNGNISTPHVGNTVAHFSWAMSNLRCLFTPLWYRGLLSFLSWWILGAWFTCSLFGTYYYSKV